MVFKSKLFQLQDSRFDFQQTVVHETNCVESLSIVVLVDLVFIRFISYV